MTSTAKVCPGGEQATNILLNRQDRYINPAMCTSPHDMTEGVSPLLGATAALPQLFLRQGLSLKFRLASNLQ